MNEKIKELAEQAGIEFVYDPTETPMRAFVECWEDEMQKFAELIVRECAKAAGDFEYARLHDSLVEDHVLKHFGVEE